MKWVVAMCAMAVACSAERVRPAADTSTTVHAPGILDEASEAFHGNELARRGWDLALCAGCHGADFRGGPAGVTCIACHPQGPDACATCHRGDTPTTAAHPAHAAQACADCHVVPARWDDPGHVLDDPPPAEVTLGAAAAHTLDPADRAGPPEFADGTCANVYCHGDVLHAGGGLATRPQWYEPAPTGGCDRCHGAPPPSHIRGDCEGCHPTAPHIDGVVQLGGGCNSCHGSAASPAPPRDLAGNQFTTAIGVGAHQVHLLAPSGLRGPIACGECHVVPATIGAVGHVDSPAPAEVEPALGWDRATATCATAWCHGPARPHWTVTGEVTCGSCHGMPPADANHAPTLTLGQCASCHPRSINPDGSFVLTGTTSEHIDGTIDFN